MQKVKTKPVSVFAIRQIIRTTGTVRNLLEQAEYIQDVGFDIHICAERADRAFLKQKGFQWIKIPRFPVKGYFRRVFFDLLVQRYINRARPDLYISHGDACSNDILAIHNCPALYYECLNDTNSKSRESVKFQERVIKKSDFRYLIANSELMRRDLIQRYDLDPSKVKVFYQGVDTTVFNNQNHSKLRRKGREVLGLDDKAYVVGLITSGSFAKRNVRFFIELAANLRTKFPETMFLIVGKDSKVKKYMQYAAQHGLKDTVIFSPPSNNVRIYYHALDLFVLPAKIEEYGRVVLEALACGIPTMIGSSVGASEIMINDSVPTVVNGWDIGEWVEKISFGINNPEKRLAQVDAGLKLAEKYSQKDYLPDMLNSLMITKT
jgi:UDP-glucose:(heptosyl)LPS alpha-1,3-glucosyltransferase